MVAPALQPTRARSRAAVLLGDDRAALAAAIRALEDAGMAGAVAGPASAPSDGILILAFTGDARKRLLSINETGHLHRGRRLIATMPDDAPPPQLRRALRSGLSGIVLDREIARALPTTVVAVSLGQICVPSALAEQVAPRHLTLRERACLKLALQGLVNAQIAAQLYVSESTVKTHLSGAFMKIGACSRAEAAAMLRDPESGLAELLSEPI